MINSISKKRLEELEEITNVCFINIDDEQHRLYECCAFMALKPTYQDFSYKESYRSARDKFKELGVEMGFDCNEENWKIYQQDCAFKHYTRQMELIK